MLESGLFCKLLSGPQRHESIVKKDGSRTARAAPEVVVVLLIESDFNSICNILC
jgi:hypothetical protein